MSTPNRKFFLLLHEVSAASLGTDIAFLCDTAARERTLVLGILRRADHFVRSRCSKRATTRERGRRYIFASLVLIFGLNVTIGRIHRFRISIADTGACEDEGVLKLLLLSPNLSMEEMLILFQGKQRAPDIFTGFDGEKTTSTVVGDKKKG